MAFDQIKNKVFGDLEKENNSSLTNFSSSLLH